LKSRTGKSTNNLYLAFQDKNKLKSVESKVAKLIGKISTEKVVGQEELDVEYE